MAGITAELIGCICQDKEFSNLIQERLKLEVKEDDIIPCETGPNVILLSDELRQNGKFANLSEFPVLQMLYNQGMGIPGHPNHTGAKPILIGAPEQVKAQKKYIKRGNYGLFTEKEITSCGIDEDVANEMMKIKLSFTSGNIKESDKLLGTIEIENEQVEIKNGVYIRRLEKNKFELKYKTETVTVDLNLKDGQKYEPAYPLNFHQIEHEYFSVIHSGEGDGSNMNRPCMSSILMYQGKIYLIDAGPNIFDTLYALGISVNTIEGIFHTHIHDDHFAGIAELMSADHKIKYYASELVSKSMRLKLEALLEADDEKKKPDNYFDFCPLELNHWNDLLGLQVMPVYSPHPVETNIFFFRTFWENGWKQYAHLADITSFSRLNDMKVKKVISEKNYNKILEYYLRPADIKKIDAGAGLIHGVASDFKNDRSGKILLSHFSDTLSDEQKEIGSGAPFGTTDVLIPATGDYLREKAFEYLYTFFFDNSALSNSEEYQLRALTSNTIEDFSPESFLIKEGNISDYVYLILTGDVEKIQTKAEIYNILSAGALIGELPSFIAAPSFVTYRSVNFVKALPLPVKQYTKFIKDNGLDQRFV
jgi:hemerythrin